MVIPARLELSFLVKAPLIVAHESMLAQALSSLAVSNSTRFSGRVHVLHFSGCVKIERASPEVIVGETVYSAGGKSSASQAFATSCGKSIRTECLEPWY